MNHLQATGFGNLVRSSFGLYFRNFPVLYGIYLLPSLPAEWWASTVLPSDGHIYGVASVVSSVVSFIVVAAMALAVSDICLGNRPAIIATYRRLAQMAGPVIWTSVLVTLIVGIAMVFFWSPLSGPEAESSLPPIVSLLMLVFGLTYLISTATYLMFALNATVLERVSGIEALKRSFHLVRGFFWRNLGVFIVTLIPMIIGALFVTLGRTSLEGLEILDEGSTIVDALVDSLVLGITVVPSYIAMVLLYFDCRIRKEQYDCEQLAQGLAQ